MVLLNAGWDLEELFLFLCEDLEGSVMLLLLDGIKGWTNLKELYIVDWLDNQMSNIYLDAMLSQGFLVSTCLERLDLSDVILEGEHIKKLATLHWASILKSLTLCHQSTLGPDDWSAILKLSSALTSLRLNGWKALASQDVAPLAALTNLKRLNLSRTGWTGQGFAELAHSLTNFTSLVAGHNDFRGIHRHVSELSMPSLKQLYVSDCGAFFSIKLDLPSLEILNLDDNNFRADGVLEGFKTQRLPLLKCLHLSRGISGDWLAELVAAGHVVCHLLEELYLTSNKWLGVAGMRALCNSPWKLKLLDIAGCDLGSEEIEALAEGNFQWLQHLDVSYNRALKAEDLTALANTANMKNIVSIKLEDTACQNSHEFEQHIVKLLRRTCT